MEGEKQLFSKVRYPSIENSYKAPYILRIRSAGYDDESIEYLVFEKIDGTNFMFVCDGKTIACGKRNSFLKPGQHTFHNFEEKRDEYREAIIGVTETFMKKDENIHAVCIHGELYGGFYPDQESDYEGKPVNKNVFYSTDINFIVFDVSFVYKEKGSGTWREWSCYAEYQPVLHKFKIPYLTPLFKGTLKEALEFPNKFVTTIPKLHGLPDLEGNIAEGVVIKPVKKLLLKGEKIMIKNKCDKFSERRKNDALSYEDIGKLHGSFSGITDYINDVRLSNVMGKMDENDAQNMGKVLSAFCEDVIKDYVGDNPETCSDISKEDMKQIKKVVGTNGYVLVKTKLKGTDSDQKKARQEKKKARELKKAIRKQAQGGSKKGKKGKKKK